MSKPLLVCLTAVAIAALYTLPDFVSTYTIQVRQQNHEHRLDWHRQEVAERMISKLALKQQYDL